MNFTFTFSQELQELRMTSLQDKMFHLRMVLSIPGNGSGCTPT